MNEIKILKEIKILDKLVRTLIDAQGSAIAVWGEIATSHAFYQSIDGNGPYAVTTSEQVIEAIHEAASCMDTAHEDIEALDRSLAEALALRLQLADVTGIPFRPTGIKAWARLIDYSL